MEYKFPRRVNGIDYLIKVDTTEHYLIVNRLNDKNVYIITAEKGGYYEMTAINKRNLTKTPIKSLKRDIEELVMVYAPSIRQD